MTRNLKALGLALVAVFAMSALVTSAASAAEFHSEGENTTVTASQVNTHVFKTTAGEVTCAKATFSGTQAAKTASSITVNATYSECHINFFGSKVSATVNMNGCDYVLYASNKADIVCPAGKKIVVSAAGCTVEVGGQTGKTTVSYTNKENKHIDITPNLTGISYNHTGFTCGTGSGTTGTYTGTTTASGNKGKIWYE
jgi:hypothetical protein